MSQSLSKDPERPLARIERADLIRPLEVSAGTPVIRHVTQAGAQAFPLNSVLTRQNRGGEIAWPVSHAS